MSQTEYCGFEQGPIRPPSEAESLLIRVTRNCPWNQCTFCPVYKAKSFSTRPIDHVLRDIDAIHNVIRRINNQEPVNDFFDQPVPDRSPTAAMEWYHSGMKSIFLQDADSLVLKPDKVLEILTHLKKCFPTVERVTTYARSKSILRFKLSDLTDLKEAGLNRIHVGLESGCDEVLKRVKKGVTKAEHIEAGQLVKAAGIELSEYVMPGLGGKELSESHALETADALNRIEPDFIRLRTLSVIGSSELCKEQECGTFQQCSNRETLLEIKTLLEKLQTPNSTLKSDHVLNLLETLEGKLGTDKEIMLDSLRRVLALDEESWTLFMIGRRFCGFKDDRFLENPEMRAHAEMIQQRYNVTPENIEQVIEEFSRQFL